MDTPASALRIALTLATIPEAAQFVAVSRELVATGQINDEQNLRLWAAVAPLVLRQPVPPA